MERNLPEWRPLPGRGQRCCFPCSVLVMPMRQCVSVVTEERDYETSLYRMPAAAALCISVCISRRSAHIRPTVQWMHYRYYRYDPFWNPWGLTETHLPIARKQSRGSIGHQEPRTQWANRQSLESIFLKRRGVVSGGNWKHTRSSHCFNVNERNCEH